MLIGAQQRFQQIEPPLPESLVVPDPFHAGVQGSRVQRADVIAALDAPLHEAGVLQHLDVLGRRGERDVERRGELPDLMRLAGENPEHLAPGRIGECVKDGVEPVGAFDNHMVEYCRSDRQIVNHTVK